MTPPWQAAELFASLPQPAIVTHNPKYRLLAAEIIHASREGVAIHIHRELTTTATADIILAIDLGRFKSVVCAYSRSTRNHAFRTIDSKPDALAQLLAEHPGSLVVIEACANAGGRGCDVSALPVQARPLPRTGLPPKRRALEGGEEGGGCRDRFGE